MRPSCSPPAPFVKASLRALVDRAIDALRTACTLARTPRSLRSSSSVRRPHARRFLHQRRDGAGEGRAHESARARAGARRRAAAVGLMWRRSRSQARHQLPPGAGCLRPRVARSSRAGALRPQRQRRWPHRRRRIRVGQPDRPAARRPRPRGGDRRLHRARPRRQRLEGDARVLLQRCRRADRQPRPLRAGARAGKGPEDPGWPEDGYRGDYILDVAQAYLRGETVEFEDHIVQGAKDPNDFDAIRRFAVAALRREQNADLAAFGVAFDVNLVLAVPGRGRGNGARTGRARPRTRKAARCGCAPPTSATTRTA